MDLLLEYKAHGIDGLKKQINTQSKDHFEKESLIKALIALSKESKVKHDMDAQKIILNQLYQLGAYQDAYQLCRKILIRKPNDTESRNLLPEIKQRLNTLKSTSSEQIDSTVSLLEKNKQIFQQIEQEVNKEIIGQEKLIQFLSKLVQKSLLNPGNIHTYKDSMIISSPKSQGVYTTINTFFKYVYSFNQISGEQIQTIDLSQYDAHDNAVEMFYVDIYNAFMGSSRVTIFKNVDQCPLDLINLLNSIVCNGYIPLDGRYTYQDGILVKVNQMLVEGSFNTIEARDQYLLFHTNEQLEKALNIFTASSQSNFTYKVSLDALDNENMQLLFKNMLNNYIEKARTNLGINLLYHIQNLSPLVTHYFNYGGAANLNNLANKIYEKVSEILLENNNVGFTNSWEIAQENNEITLKDAENSYHVLDVYQTHANLSSIKERIEQLIGLDEVKDSLKELKIFLEKRERKLSKGYQSEKPALHFVFTGNPGTGKTTVARLIAEYLKTIGYLSEGHLIEVDRSDLVGKYVGHTAAQTMNRIKAAIGGVLFIDEAYSLARGGENDFGREAIDTIVKAMEDYKNQLVVIFAGYPKEIDDLLELNPGLRSRISQTFLFNDYTTEELLEISHKLAKERGFQIEEAAQKQLIKYYQKHQIKGKTDSGNGRLARQTIENAIKKQAVRTATEDINSKIDILNLEDFGLKEEKVFDLDSNLNDIIGLNHIKELIKTLQKQELINKRRKEFNSNFISNQSLNFIFTGNPGTGKTTISRTITELFKSIDILKKGHLVEVARTELVASYVGQTALKTEKVFKSALGGVLFIDEAYTLANDQFGEEAINTLIKLMEDHKEDIVVILAGYEEHMNKLLQTNPGIKSRFSNIFHFPDYSCDELYAIAIHLFSNKGFILGAEAKTALQTVIQQTYQDADGNGRYVRNIVERVIRLQSIRLFEISATNYDILMEILPEDIRSLS
ncbi:AAA family ATPase [Oceanobacillus bengalensis]|nr:AAA family ATPase [Oceanobacillus bengalensis]